MYKKKVGMGLNSRFIKYTVLPLSILVFSFALRRYFFCGFILGDDAEEFPLIKHIMTYGPDFQGHLQYRFGMWIFNLLSFKWLGISETAFFLPTWIMSASLSVIGFYILLLWQYRAGHAFLANLFIASAPFEVLIGTVRANDLILSWFLALGLLCFILLEKRSVIQGILVALFLWLAFYTKLWVIYLFPALGLYYIIQIVRERVWRGLIGFSLTSLFLHGITGIFWKIKLGTFLPFLAKLSATYPVAYKDLPGLFLQYPKMIFLGSEFGTTLFGFIPYLLFILLLLKIILSMRSEIFPDYPRLDRFDLYLLIYYGIFFLFLNFFSNNFKFDQYYSAPRIFRYMAPISFPMTLHLAKLILDFSMIDFKFNAIKKYIASALFVPLIIINLYQTDSATQPGQVYRKALLSIVKDVREQSPPQLLVESWLGFFLKEIYLKDKSDTIPITPVYGVYAAKKYEEWLKMNQNKLPAGTMLITGLSSYIHYGAHFDGFRLSQFNGSLYSGWKLFKEYGALDYLPYKEAARLWQWSGVAAGGEAGVFDSRGDADTNDPVELFKRGMTSFENGDYPNARLYYQKVIQGFSDWYMIDHAVYYTAICHFREGHWEATISEFNKLITNYPKSIWIVGAHYHMGLSYEELKGYKRARGEFQYVIDHFSSDINMVHLAKERLKELPQESGGIIERLLK